MKERFETFTVLINRISRNIKKIENLEMADHNLRSSHISCLYYLYSSSELTAKSLCEKCEEDKATVSRAISYLEKEGYLTCESKSPKRYNAALILTPKGMEAGKKISDKINYVLDEVSIGLSEEERLAFYRSLKTISDNLDKICNNSAKNIIERI